MSYDKCATTNTPLHYLTLLLCVQLMNDNVMKEAELMSEQQQRLQQDYEAALLSIDQLTQHNRQIGQQLKVSENRLSATARLHTYGYVRYPETTDMGTRFTGFLNLQGNF